MDFETSRCCEKAAIYYETGKERRKYGSLKNIYCSNVSTMKIKKKKVVTTCDRLGLGNR